VPAKVLDFWEAFDAVEPIGEAWRQTAETNTLIERLIELKLVQYGSKFAPATVESNMPARYRREKKQPAIVQVVESDPVSEFEKLGAALGLGEVIKKHGNNNKPR
jgi:hypothetical protein